MIMIIYVGTDFLQPHGWALISLEGYHNLLRVVSILELAERELMQVEREHDGALGN
jgi:hypothetical protein